MASVDVWFLIVSAATATPGMVGPLESQEACEKLVTQYRDGGVFCKRATMEKKECDPRKVGEPCPVWTFKKSDDGEKK